MGRLTEAMAITGSLPLSVTPGKACYIPVKHDYPGVPDQLDRDETLNALREAGSR